MADIKIKITADTSELKKDVSESSKLLKRMEKGHEKSTKKRAVTEAKTFLKIDKGRKKLTKDTLKDNKLLERENKKRLDREVKAEEQAAREKGAAREKFKGFALAAGGQAFGVLGQGQLGAGLALAGQGGILGLGVGVGIAAVGAIATVVRNLVGFQDELIRFGFTARMTNKELIELESQLGIIATTTGAGRLEMLDALKEIFKFTRTVPALDQMDDLFKTMRVTGLTGAEFGAAFEKMGTALKTTDFGKIFKALQLFTVTGDVMTAIDALGAFPNIKKSEKSLINLSNVLQLRTFKDMEDLKRFNKDLKREGITLFKPDNTPEDFNTILRKINEAKERYNKLGQEEPEVLRNINVNKIHQVKTISDAMGDINDKMTELDKSPLTAFEKMKGLFEMIVSGTAMGALEKGAESLNKFLGDPKRITEFNRGLREIADNLKHISTGAGWAGEAISALLAFRDPNLMKNIFKRQFGLMGTEEELEFMRRTMPVMGAERIKELEEAARKAPPDAITGAGPGGDIIINMTNNVDKSGEFATEIESQGRKVYVRETLLPALR